MNYKNYDLTLANRAVNEYQSNDSAGKVALFNAAKETAGEICEKYLEEKGKTTLTAADKHEIWKRMKSTLDSGKKLQVSLSRFSDSPIDVTAKRKPVIPTKKIPVYAIKSGEHAVNIGTDLSVDAFMVTKGATLTLTDCNDAYVHAASGSTINMNNASGKILVDGDAQINLNDGSKIVEVIPLDDYNEINQYTISTNQNEPQLIVSRLPLE
ncbi:MAG: hypothetical protein ACD_73C00208G0004 [uncultured bacterium]|nr:MAG: hypothetical protein ACD_73C00208G0004 [uncultured bacterium]